MKVTTQEIVTCQTNYVKEITLVAHTSEQKVQRNGLSPDLLLGIVLY